MAWAQLTSPHWETFSTVATGRPALALAPQPAAKLLHCVGNHYEAAERDAEQDDRYQVAQLELPELQVRWTRALPPPELLVGEVQPPRGNHAQEKHGQKHDDQRGDDCLGPRPLELLDGLLEALHARRGALLQALGEHSCRA